MNNKSRPHICMFELTSTTSLSVRHKVAQTPAEMARGTADQRMLEGLESCPPASQGPRSSEGAPDCHLPLTLERCPPPPYRLSLSLPILAPSPGRLEEIARKRRQRRARWDLAVAIIATSLVHQRNHEFQFTVGKTDHNDQDYDDH